MGSDGSVFLAGDTSGDWDGVNEGGRDFAACKLDVNGTEIWRWQVKRLPTEMKETLLSKTVIDPTSLSSNRHSCSVLRSDEGTILMSPFLYEGQRR